MFSLLQTILGFQPDAPNEMLYLDPTLPDWIPDLTVRDLKLGSQKFDIRFRRNDTETVVDVLSGPSDRVVRRSMTQWATLLRG
jgi:hypothetical protein